MSRLGRVALTVVATPVLVVFAVCAVTAGCIAWAIGLGDE